MSFNYVAKQRVRAAKWTGDNLDEMKVLLRSHVDGDDEGPFVYSDWVEPIAIHGLSTFGGYNLLTFYAGDDMEVDPGQWVVVYDQDEIVIMGNGQFNRMFEKED